jgi:hypothetical protein
MFLYVKLFKIILMKYADLLINDSYPIENLVIM